MIAMGMESIRFLKWFLKMNFMFKIRDWLIYSKMKVSKVWWTNFLIGFLIQTEILTLKSWQVSFQNISNSNKDWKFSLEKKKILKNQTEIDLWFKWEDWLDSLKYLVCLKCKNSNNFDLKLGVVTLPGPFIVQGFIWLVCIHC